MILAGIDEAGYGPLLGPLVVGCSAFDIGECDGEELPCLWKRLRRIISKNRSRSGRKLHVNDSKLVYSPAAGLKELERSVLVMSSAVAGSCADLNDLLARAAPHVLDDLPGYRWYQPAIDERFPIEQDPAAIGVFTNAVKDEMHRGGAQLIHLGARVVLEGQLNRMLDQTRNKSNTLFSTVAIHLDHLLRNYGTRGLTIVCDRQGGRSHYGSLLRMMFDQWSLEVTMESEARSEYRLRQNGHDVRILFTEKAETDCMAVALASMLCKYLREALMRRFNAFWRLHLPRVDPTAGYYNDGSRFLRDIDAKRRELGIGDAELIRCR